MIQQSAASLRVSEPSMPDGSHVDPIHIHTPPPRGMAFAEPQQPGSNGIKPFAYLKYRWVTMLFFGGFLGVLLAGIAWKVIPPKYTTYSMIRVFSDNPVVYSVENVHGRSDLTTYIKTQAAMIRSPFVLTAALRDPAVASLPMLREQTDPVRYLEEELKIESPEGSEMIKVSLSGDNPAACAMIVNSIQEAYFREVVDKEAMRKKERLKTLEDEIAKSQKELKAKFGQINLTKVDKPENEAFAGLNATLAANQVFDLEKTRAKLEADIASWESQKASLERRLKNLDNEAPPLPAGFSQSMESDPKMQALRKKIETLNAKAEQLARLSGDPKLNTVLEIRQKAAAVLEEVERLKNEKIAEYQKSQLPAAEHKLKADLEQANANIDHITSQKEKLEESYSKYKAIVDENGPEERLPDFLKVDVRERIKIIKEMHGKADLLRLEVDAPPRVFDFQRAAVPLKKEMKKQLFGTILAGMLGFGLVGLGVVLHESRVRRAMSLAEIQKSILGPVIGVLPSQLDGANALASAELTREAIEKARTNLWQQFARPGNKVIAVTSALTEEGKTFVASQLAESFARVGNRTLLIDFDLRSPALHTTFGVSNECGMCEVMLNKIEFKDAVRVLPNGMMFVPAGAWEANVRLGLTSEHLEAFLNWLRPQFDCVILNTHPLLAVAESYLLCRNADGVLLSVQRLKSRVPFVARAHEKIAMSAPEALGLVFQDASDEECLQ